MARDQPRDRADPGFNPVIEQAVASPVDTYVKPPAETQGQQLARALAEVQPSVGRFSETLAQDYVDKQKEQGTQAARMAAEDAQRAGDMTRQGQLPQQQNPYFMSGYEEEQGRVAAGQWDSDFTASSLQDQALQSSTNLADFDKAAGQSIADFMQKNGIQRTAEFERGFGHMKDAYVAKQRLKFAEGIEKKLGTRSDENLFALSKRAITDNWGRDGMTPEAIAADIDGLVNAQVLRGRPESNAHKAAAAAIRAAALENPDPDKGRLILGLMGKVKGEQGQGALQDQSYGAKLREETEDTLIQQGHQQITYQREADKAAQQKERDQVGTEAVAALKDNPGMNIALWFKKTHPDFNDPEMVPVLHKLQDEWSGSYFDTNPYTQRKLFNDIWAPKPGDKSPSVEDIIKASRNNQLRPQDAMSLINMLQAGGTSDKDPEDQRAAPYLKYTEHFFDDFFKNPITGITADDLAERVRNSHASVLSRWWNLKSSGASAKMSSDELNKWFMSQSQDIAAQQKSQLSISIDGAPPARLGPAPGTSQPWVSPLQTPDIPAKGSSSKPQAPEMPDGPVLTPSDIINYMQGNDQAIKGAMQKYGIPASQMKQFILKQKKLLEPTKAP